MTRREVNPERRNFLKHGRDVAAGLSLGYFATQIPRVYGEPLTIPKLSYSPTIDQLISDYSLQKEMLALDLQTFEYAAVYGKAALGFDDNYVDFVVAKTSHDTEPTSSIFLQLAIDRDHSGGSGPDADDFDIVSELFLQTQKKDALVYSGNGWSNTAILTFPWYVSRATSYFSPYDENYLFALQIPNSYMGPGGPGGLYGFNIGVVEDNATNFPGYPYSGDFNTPSTWATFEKVAAPVPEFPSPLIAALCGIVGTQLYLANWRKKRIESKRSERAIGNLT